MIIWLFLCFVQCYCWCSFLFPRSYVYNVYLYIAFPSLFMYHRCCFCCMCFVFVFVADVLWQSPPPSPPIPSYSHSYHIIIIIISCSFLIHFLFKRTFAVLESPKKDTNLSYDVIVVYVPMIKGKLSRYHAYPTL